MSTRKILKERRRAFEFLLKDFPDKEGYKMAIKEIDFILDKLRKEYDKRTN